VDAVAVPWLHCLEERNKEEGTGLVWPMGGVDGSAGGGRQSLECRLTPLRSVPLISPELVHLWLCLWHLNSTHRYFPVTGRREREEERERRQYHGRQQPRQKKVDFEITNVSKFQSMEEDTNIIHRATQDPPAAMAME
jgi:hypothetical protein